MKKCLIAILIIASLLRFYGLNWDQNQHLHPDERMIVLVTLKIHWPQNSLEYSQLLTPASPLNPQFFAYGSLPIYFLKIAGYLTGLIIPLFSSYDGINLVGRSMSALFDLGTIIILYLLGQIIFTKKSVGLLAASFYAISVLPIQLSHFYAVDTPLTFFVLAALYRLIKLHNQPEIKNAIFVGILFGLALATKTSALVLAAPVGITLILVFYPKDLSPTSLITSIKKSVLVLSPLALSIIITFVIFEPYALIDWLTFWRQTLEQQAMTKDAFTFPYTLQYVGKAPYLYELKNIFLWGLGPVLSVLAFGGSLLITYQSLRADTWRVNSADTFKKVVLISFFWVYFLVVGSFAIGFMRYMLPLYPLLCLFAAFFLNSLKLLRILKRVMLPSLILNSGLLILIVIWPLSFISIYSHPNTRTSASKWIYQNISPGSSIATEHWDDGLPAGGQVLYQHLELPMYDPDLNPAKWAKVNSILNQTQYIIIASNRLYGPLQRLTNCQTLPLGRCYPKTAEYYHKLFSGQLGFSKVAEFKVLPTIPIINYPIDDSSADESFTVYDHPKVIIFQKQHL